MDFTCGVVAIAIGAMRRDVGVPAADKTSVELQYLGTFGIRAFRMKNGGEVDAVMVHVDLLFSEINTGRAAGLGENCDAHKAR